MNEKAASILTEFLDENWYDWDVFCIARNADSEDIMEELQLEAGE